MFVHNKHLLINMHGMNIKIKIYKRNLVETRVYVILSRLIALWL